MATFSTYKTSLATKATRGAGLGVNDAVAAAQRNLDGMHDRILIEVDQQLAKIQSLMPQLAQEDPAASAAIVAYADTLTGVCASPDLQPIGDVARRVCKLADELEGPLPGQTVTMLINAMMLLRDQTDDRRQTVWSELQGGVDAAVEAVTQRRLRRSVSPSALPVV